MSNGVAGFGGGIVPTLGKRKADESTLNDSDRFAKRFNLLSLDIDNAGPHNNSNYYIPVSSTRSSPAAAAVESKHNLQHGSSQASWPGEDMQIDDTRDRIFIRNLDDELADEQPDEEKKLVFLPDIEKHFSRIPQQILRGRRDNEHENQELVLYNVPKSLTVDEDRDTVRKAIIEARRRARERALEDARQYDMNCKYDQKARGVPGDVETAHGYNTGYVADNPADSDAMDMD